MWSLRLAANRVRDHCRYVAVPVALRNWASGKLTWLVLGGDPAVRSRRVEQFTAL